MKKWIGIAMFIAVAVVVMHWPHQVAAQTQSNGQKEQLDSNYLEQAFAATDATASGFEIHSWSQLDGNFDEMSQIAKIVGETAQDLSITHAKVIKRAEHNERFYEIQGNRPGGASVAVIVTSLWYANATANSAATSAATQDSTANPSQSANPSRSAAASQDATQSGNAQTVMVVREDATKYSKSILSADFAQINKSARNWANDPVISACIEGSTGDKMGDAATKRMIQHVFSTVKAKRVEGITTGDVTSISGYSPLGSDFIQTNGRKMNLQVGLHYNHIDHHTNVVVGTPIITITY